MANRVDSEGRPISNKKYEYAYFDEDPNRSTFLGLRANLAQEGWELVDTKTVGQKIIGYKEEWPCNCESREYCSHSSENVPIYSCGRTIYYCRKEI